MEDTRKTDLQKRVSPYVLTDSNNRRDICSIYKNQPLLKDVIDYLAEPFQGKVDYVAAPESLGFILGGMMASALGVGFIPVRNGDISVIPDQDAARASYIDHNDQARSLQVRSDAAFQNARVLLVDDWIESGVTIQTCIAIAEELQAQVVGIASLGASLNHITEKMLADGQIQHIL